MNLESAASRVQDVDIEVFEKVQFRDHDEGLSLSARHLANQGHHAWVTLDGLPTVRYICIQLDLPHLMTAGRLGGPMAADRPADQPSDVCLEPRPSAPRTRPNHFCRRPSHETGHSGCALRSLP